MTQKTRDFISQYPLLTDAATVLDESHQIHIFRNEREQSIDIVDIIGPKTNRKLRTVAYVKYVALGDNPNGAIGSLVAALFTKGVGR